MNYLDSKELAYLHMSDRDRQRKGIFQGENSYCHYSKCHYYNGPSQRLAFVCAEGYAKINLEKYKDCKWELCDYDVRIDGVLISCSWSEFIPNLLKDLDEILKMRAENEAKRIQLKNPVVNTALTTDDLKPEQDIGVNENE